MARMTQTEPIGETQARAIVRHRWGLTAADRCIWVWIDALFIGTSERR
jgi:hypothetical protein